MGTVSYQYSSGGVEHHCAALWGGMCVGRGWREGTLVCGEVEGRGCVIMEVYVEVVSSPDPNRAERVW